VGGAALGYDDKTVVSGGHDGNTLLLNISNEFHVAITDAMAV